MKIFLFLCFIFFFPQQSWAVFRCEHPTWGETPIQTVRNFFWMVIGSPGTTEYNCATQNDSTMQRLLPQKGILGEIESIRSDISTQLLSILGSKSTCDSLPSTGSSQLGNNIIVYYQSPQNTIPATFPNAGAYYQKRLKYVDSSNDDTIIFEFDCSEQRMMAKRTKNNTSDSYLKMAVFYDNSTSTKYVDVYLDFYKNMNANNRIVLALVFRIDSSNNNFQLWLTRTGHKVSDGSDFAAYRFVANVNYSTQQTSIFYHDISGVGGLTTSNYTGQANVNSATVTGINAPNAGASDSLRQGCATSFNDATAEITSSTLCTGLNLNASPNTAFGDSLSMQSVHTNVVNRLNAL